MFVFSFFSLLIAFARHPSIPLQVKVLKETTSDYSATITIVPLSSPVLSGWDMVLDFSSEDSLRSLKHAAIALSETSASRTNSSRYHISSSSSTKTIAVGEAKTVAFSAGKHQNGSFMDIGAWSFQSLECGVEYWVQVRKKGEGERSGKSEPRKEG